MASFRFYTDRRSTGDSDLIYTEDQEVLLIWNKFGDDFWHLHIKIFFNTITVSNIRIVSKFGSNFLTEFIWFVLMIQSKKWDGWVM